MSRRALLIGNGTFDENSGLPSLYGPRHDIVELSKVLGRSGGFSVTKLPDRSAAEIRSQVGSTLEEAGQDDLIFIHYSGHGRRGKRGLFLAARDSHGDRLSTMISIGAIRDAIEESHCQRIVLSLDCCFSGAALDAWTRADAHQTSTELEKSAGPGFFILASSSRVTTSEEREIIARGIRIGAMTSLIVEGIRSGAAASSDGSISLANVVKYLSTNITRQKPQFFGKGDSSRIILARIRTSQFGVMKRIEGWKKSGNLTSDQAGRLKDLVKITKAGFQAPGAAELSSYLDWPDAKPETAIALLDLHSPKSQLVTDPARPAQRKRRQPSERERHISIENVFVTVCSYFERRISQSGYEGYLEQLTPRHLHAFMPEGDTLMLGCLWLGEAWGLWSEKPSICFKCGLCIPKDRIVIEQESRPLPRTWPDIDHASAGQGVHLEFRSGNGASERLTVAALAQRLWSRFLDPEIRKQGLQEAKEREEIRRKAAM